MSREGRVSALSSYGNEAYRRRNASGPRGRIDTIGQGISKGRRRIQQLQTFVEAAENGGQRAEAQAAIEREQAKVGYLEELQKGNTAGARRKSIRSFAVHFGESKKRMLGRLSGVYERQKSVLDMGLKGGVLSEEQYAQKKGLLDQEYQKKRTQITGGLSSIRNLADKAVIKNMSRELVTGFKTLGGKKEGEAPGGEGTAKGRSEKEGLSRTENFVHRFSASFKGNVEKFTNKSAKTIGAFVKGVGKVAGPLGAIATGAMAIGTQYLASFSKANKIEKDVADRGRTLRGLNIDFGQMARAIGIGRRYGISQEQMMNTTARMQNEMFAARWGRGDMINRLGEWGLSPFKQGAPGGTMSPHEMRIAISNKLNELIAKGGTDLGAQFLSAQGIDPSEFRMYRNYAREAKKRGSTYEDSMTASLLGENEDMVRMSERMESERVVRQQKREQNLRRGWSGMLSNALDFQNWGVWDDMKIREKAEKESHLDKAIKRAQEGGAFGNLKLDKTGGWMKEAWEKNGSEGIVGILEGMGTNEAERKGIFESGLRQLKNVYGIEMSAEDLKNVTTDDAWEKSKKDAEAFADLLARNQNTDLDEAGIKRAKEAFAEKNRKEFAIKSGAIRTYGEKDRNDLKLLEEYEALETKTEKAAFLDEHGRGFLDARERTKGKFDIASLSQAEKAEAIRNRVAAFRRTGQHTELGNEALEDLAYEEMGFGFKDRTINAKNRMIKKAEKEARDKGLVTQTEIDDYVNKSLGITEEDRNRGIKNMNEKDMVHALLTNTAGKQNNYNALNQTISSSEAMDAVKAAAGIGANQFTKGDQKQRAQTFQRVYKEVISMMEQGYGMSDEDKKKWASASNREKLEMANRKTEELTNLKRGGDIVDIGMVTGAASKSDAAKKRRADYEKQRQGIRDRIDRSYAEMNKIKEEKGEDSEEYKKARAEWAAAQADMKNLDKSFADNEKKIGIEEAASKGKDAAKKKGGAGSMSERRRQNLEEDLKKLGRTKFLKKHGKNTLKELMEAKKADKAEEGDVGATADKSNEAVSATNAAQEAAAQAAAGGNAIVAAAGKGETKIENNDNSTKSVTTNVYVQGGKDPEETGQIVGNATTKKVQGLADTLTSYVNNKEPVKSVG